MVLNSQLYYSYTLSPWSHKCNSREHSFFHSTDVFEHLRVRHCTVTRIGTSHLWLAEKWQGQKDQPHILSTETGWRGDQFYKREVTCHRAKKAGSQMAPDASISGCSHRLENRFCMRSLKRNMSLALVYKSCSHTKIAIVMSNVIISAENNIRGHGYWINKWFKVGSGALPWPGSSVPSPMH